MDVEGFTGVDTTDIGVIEGGDLKCCRILSLAPLFSAGCTRSVRLSIRTDTGAIITEIQDLDLSTLSEQECMITLVISGSPSDTETASTGVGDE